MDLIWGVGEITQCDSPLLYLSLTESLAKYVNLSIYKDIDVLKASNFKILTR